MKTIIEMNSGRSYHGFGFRIERTSEIRFVFLLKPNGCAASYSKIQPVA